MARVGVILLVVIILPLFVLLQSSFSPFGSHVPSIDQGAYTYTAWRMMEGDRLYVDVWDHKGPLLYLMYQLGLVLGGVVGVWLVDLVLLVVSCYLLFQLLERLFGWVPAAVGVGLGSVVLVRVLEQGALTEDLTMIFTVLALYGASRFMLGELRVRAAVLWGLVAGLSFAALLLVRVNMVAPLVGAAVGVCVSGWRDRRDGALFLGGGVLGLGSAVVGTIAWVASITHLEAFRSAYLDYNLSYSGVPMGLRLHALREQLLHLAKPGGAAVLLLWAVVWVVIDLLRRRGENRTLLWSWVIGLLVTSYSIVMSGRVYYHYVIALIPFIAFFTAYLFRRLIEAGPTWRGWRAYSAAAVLGACGLLALQTLYQNGRFVAQSRTFDRNAVAVAAWIEERTLPGEPVFFWGEGGSVGWMAKRRPASPFFYSLPILSRSYPPADVQTVVGQLEREKPKVIVDRSPYGEFKYTLRSEDFRWPRADLAEFYGRDINSLQHYVREHYEFAGTVGKTELYVRKG